jgi:hypothetical protein
MSEGTVEKHVRSVLSKLLRFATRQTIIGACSRCSLSSTPTNRNGAHRMSSCGHPGPEALTSVEQALADRVAVRAELKRHYIYGHVIQGGRDERPALSLQITNV